MERTIWNEFDVNDFLFHLESIQYYEEEMEEEKDDARLKARATERRDSHIRSLQKKVRLLKGTDFTAALDLVKEMFPGRQQEISGICNF